MKFEYDPNKSASNKIKHGIDFEEAQALWQDEVAIRAEAGSETEPRYMLIGRIGNVFWTAIATDRGEVVRIISVRRSREKEVMHYGKINFC